MTIDHEQLRIDLEEKFADRFTEKDEDYAKALKSRNIQPPCIYPWFNHRPQRRDGFQHNQNNQRYSQQQSFNQYNQDRPDQSGGYKRRRYE